MSICDIIRYHQQVSPNMICFPTVFFFSASITGLPLPAGHSLLRYREASQCSHLSHCGVHPLQERQTDQVSSTLFTKLKKQDDTWSILNIACSHGSWSTDTCRCFGLIAAVHQVLFNGAITFYLLMYLARSCTLVIHARTHAMLMKCRLCMYFVLISHYFFFFWGDIIITIKLSLPFQYFCIN